MQTNEIQNRIMHFGRNADGQLELRESIPTGGAGSGVFKPISGQESAPNAFEGAGSVILAESNTLLFTTNGGDNSVTSFRVSPDGKLTVIDRQPTGEPVTGRSGTAKSLAYRPQSRTLYVLHAFGPNHLRSYTVAEDGKLKLRPEHYSVNTATKTDRVSTQAVLSPDGRFLLVDILFDARPAANPDGSPNLVVANAPDPDGLVIFPVRDDGTLEQGFVCRCRRRRAILHRLPQPESRYLPERCRGRGRRASEPHRWRRTRDQRPIGRRSTPRKGSRLSSAGCR